MAESDETSNQKEPVQGQCEMERLNGFMNQKDSFDHQRKPHTMQCKCGSPWTFSQEEYQPCPKCNKLGFWSAESADSSPDPKSPGNRCKSCKGTRYVNTSDKHEWL